MNVKETGQVSYQVEWESSDEPGLWLGGYLFEFNTPGEADKLYLKKVEEFSSLKWRIVRKTVVTKIEEVYPNES